MGDVIHFDFRPDGGIDEICRRLEGLLRESLSLRGVDSPELLRRLTENCAAEMRAIDSAMRFTSDPTKPMDAAVAKAIEAKMREIGTTGLLAVARSHVDAALIAAEVLGPSR